MLVVNALPMNLIDDYFDPCAEDCSNYSQELICAAQKNKLKLFNNICELNKANCDAGSDENPMFLETDIKKCYNSEEINNLIEDLFKSHIK